MTRLFAGTPFDRPPVCERCGRPESECACPPNPPAAPLPAQKAPLRLSVEKRRKGKTVTVIRGLVARPSQREGLLKRLKSECGAGGSLDGDDLEIQGDHRARLRTLLADLGFRIAP